MSTEALLRERLATLTPSLLEIQDDSARHAGHAGAARGGKHFIVRIASPKFIGAGRLARQRLVMDAAGDLMHEAIHALSVEAVLPEDV